MIASTREGRVGAPVADWFTARAPGTWGFEVELVDLKAVDLPLLSEPNHFVAKLLEGGTFIGGEIYDKSAMMLDELAR